MGRPATGNARWDTKTSCWVARVTMPDGSRRRIPMQDKNGGHLVAPCLESMRDPSPSCPCDSCSRAKVLARKISDRVRHAGLTQGDRLKLLTSRLDAIELEAKKLRRAIEDLGGWVAADGWNEDEYLARTGGSDDLPL